MNERCISVDDVINAIDNGEICDEIHFTGDVVKKIEQIIASAKQHLQELSVVNFATAA